MKIKKIQNKNTFRFFNYKWKKVPTWAKDTDKRYKGKRSWNFNTSVQGWRYHMSNIMAAIGIEQLKRFPDFAKKRQELAKYYDILFQDYPFYLLHFILE